MAPHIYLSFIFSQIFIVFDYYSLIFVNFFKMGIIRFRFQKVKKDMIFGTIIFLKMMNFIKLEINCYNDKMCNSFS